MLYVQFTTLEGVRKKRSTGLKDTVKNRKLVEREVLPRLEAELKMGNFREKEIGLFEMYAEKMLKQKTHLRTYGETEQRVIKINKVFGKREITDIKPLEIEEYLYGLNLHPKTARIYLANISGAFKMAIKAEEIERNPCDLVELPKGKTPDASPFSSEEVERILEKANPVWFRNFLAIAFYTGMRTGEIMALMWSDIKSNHIEINRSIRHGIISDTKTKNGLRQIPIFDVLKPYLASQKNNSLWLFPNSNGGPHFNTSKLTGCTKKGRWARLLQSLDIPYRRIYETRHTFATAMLSSGHVSIMELARIMGHGGPEMILRKYAKFVKSEQLKVNSSINPFEFKSENSALKTS